MWVPTLGALATRLLTGQGLRGWQLKPRLRAAWKEHLTGWFAPFLFTLVGAGTYFLIFRGRFDRFAALKGMLRQAAGTTFLDAMTPPALAALLLFSAAAAVPLVSICSGPLGEELGWRGYLYPVLCAWMPRRQAMLVSGVVWGVWHAPLLIMGWDYGTSYPGYPVCGIAVMTLCTVCLGAFQCWLVDRAGSIWPAVLAHGAVNTLFSLYLLGGNFCAEPFNPLLGASPDPELVRQLRELVLSHPQVVGIHDMIIHDYGPGRRLCSFHAEVPQDADILAAHDAIDHIEREIQEKFGIETTVHMDPIATDDEKVTQLRARVAALAQAVEPEMTIHDFRVVEGPTHTNVIFDAVVPHKCRLSDQEVRERLSRSVTALDSAYQAVIQIDRAYVEAR